MARSRQAIERAANLNKLGIDAARKGDYAAARRYLSQAINSNPDKAGYHHNHANVLARLGKVAAAVQELTKALQLDRELEDAARQASTLLSRYSLEDYTFVDPAGLKAALHFETVDRQPLAEAALRHLATRPQLTELLETGRTEGWEAAARAAFLPHPKAVLRDELLLSALHTGLVTDAEFERFLTALRRVMATGAKPQQLVQPGHREVVLALIEQCRLNGHVFAVSAAEAEALSALELDGDALFTGDTAAAAAFMVRALYTDPVNVLAELTRDDPVRIKPRPLRNHVLSWLATHAREQELAATIEALEPVSNTASERVRRQYEENPYPRWSSLQAIGSASLRTGLAKFASRDELAFMDAPFGVLIAGAGTGKHALQSCYGYGENARVLGIDLSRRSLGYAARMAERFDVPNLSLLQADILSLAAGGQQFDVIECVGVLHDTAEPLVAWDRLTACLKPGGLMYVGLYSTHSRRNIAALRAEPGYPGPDCTDAEARAYRASLTRRPEGEVGTELLRSPDFYSLAGFRDLVLHPCEHTFTWPEIAAFLAEHALEFRGFTLDKQWIDAFQTRFPEDHWPGTPENWDTMEQEQPHLFDTMYRFWCIKAA